MQSQLKHEIVTELVNNIQYKDLVIEILSNYLDDPDKLNLYVGEIRTKHCGQNCGCLDNSECHFNDLVI